jgi:predicted NUDIX family phosphoesterase
MSLDNTEEIVSEPNLTDAFKGVHGLYPDQGAVEEIVEPKMALCIDTSDVNRPMAEWMPRLVDRAICETDETMLQIIPYVSLVNEHQEVCIYTRGDKGGEPLLFKLKSMGFGGHIDNVETSNVLQELIVSEAIREVQEETGYACPLEVMQNALNGAILLYNPTNEVSKYHVAIAMVVAVKTEDLKQFEEGQITNVEWLTLETLNSLNNIQNVVKPEALAWKFESWTSELIRIHMGLAIKQMRAQQMAMQAQQQAALEQQISQSTAHNNQEVNGSVTTAPV